MTDPWSSHPRPPPAVPPRPASLIQYEEDIQKALALSVETAEMERLSRLANQVMDKQNHQQGSNTTNVASSSVRSRPKPSSASSEAGGSISLPRPSSSSKLPENNQVESISQPLIVFSPDSKEKAEKFKSELPSLYNRQTSKSGYSNQLDTQNAGFTAAFGGQNTTAYNAGYSKGISPTPSTNTSLKWPMNSALQTEAIPKPSSYPNLSHYFQNSTYGQVPLMQSASQQLVAAGSVGSRSASGSPTFSHGVKPVNSNQSLVALNLHAGRVEYNATGSSQMNNGGNSGALQLEQLMKQGEKKNKLKSGDLIYFDDRQSSKHQDVAWESFDPLSNFGELKTDEPDKVQLDSPKTSSPIDSGKPFSRPDSRSPDPDHYLDLDEYLGKQNSPVGEPSHPCTAIVPYNPENAFTDNFTELCSGDFGLDDTEIQDPFSINELNRALASKKKRQLQVKPVSREPVTPESAPETEYENRSEDKPPPRPPKSWEVRQKYLSPIERMTVGLDGIDQTQAFYQVVKRLKQQYPYNDSVHNPGVVLSSLLSDVPLRSMTVKLAVKTVDFGEEPVVFTCDVQATVEHVISNVLYTLCDDMGTVTTDNFVLKVHGLSEYLDNQCTLGNYEYVQQCIKLDTDIKLLMMKCDQVEAALKRTRQDDNKPLIVHRPESQSKDGQVTKESLKILMDTFSSQIEKLQDAALEGASRLQPKNIIQSVRAVSAILFKLETNAVTKAVEKLIRVTNDWHATDDLQLKSAMVNDLEVALDNLNTAVQQVVQLYCKMFHIELPFEQVRKTKRDVKEVTDNLDSMIVHIASVHRLPQKWRTNFDHYQVVCSLHYGGHRLYQDVETTPKHSSGDNFCDKVIWDEWLPLDGLPLCTLPRETRLIISLCAVKNITSGAEAGKSVKTNLGWVAIQLFDFKGHLTQGSQLIPLWPGDPKHLGTNEPNIMQTDSILIQMSLPDFEADVVFPTVMQKTSSESRDFDSLHPDTKSELQEIINKDPVAKLSDDEKEMLWEKRHYLYHEPNALPKVLQAAPSWDWACLSDIYAMLNEWSPLPPVVAMQLLLPSFADTTLRDTAVHWIEALSVDEMTDYLPQLVQALKFENYMTSSLSLFLLERALKSVRISHQLFWLLKEASGDLYYRSRYQLMFGALMSVAGEALCKELQIQEGIVRQLGDIAEKVKNAKDKDATLSRELDPLYQQLHDISIRLPLNPSMEVSTLDTKTCSYYTSNAFPLKLVFKNVDPTADSIYTMFKVGDDIRQDMLTMQLIRIMDKLWLREGLDLKIITFTCLPTAMKKGMVELVTECDTLRKIQVGFGLTGSFKDRPISEWLQKHNPTELEYQKAVSNFTLSCAGYCVATYVLGICDRHNDNIMLKQSGHLFHIDFGKFLGDSQMFGSIKRDRVPFVLTADMAYVINGGNKPTQKFQQFVDLCCQAFNIIRKHGSCFINLIRLMEYSGIPGVTIAAAKYIQRALLPERSDAEATAAFTRMIEESLKSVFTQFNFFLHNLAQLKFSSHTEGELLSFIPKTYSISTDGPIDNVEIFGYQKRYNPEKYYIYIIKVGRKNQRVPNFVFRKYSEFQEFHSKLVTMFPLARLPSLQGRVMMGRTHVKSVAERRKTELEHFLRDLLHLAPEISECDLVYTFFHSVLRDEQDIDSTNLQKLKEPKPVIPLDRIIHGQIKMSLHYKNDAFYIMVMHVKDLAKESGETPDPYVKTYLLPDPNKMSKRKTKIVHGSFHPTYNEMLIYRLPLTELQERVLQVTIWNYDRMKENEFLGAVLLNLSSLDLTKECTRWYNLEKLMHSSLG